MIWLLDLLGLNNLTFGEFLWVAFGTLGQMIFFTRWIVQWFSSEKSKTSVIPVAFWWCNWWNYYTCLCYHIQSFPFMLAQAIGIIVYSRNLLLVIGEKKKFIII